jgi:hypothetical protein
MAIIFFFVLISCNNQKYKIIFCDFGEANVSIKSMDYSSVSWRTHGDHPDRSPLNPALALSFCDHGPPCARVASFFLRVLNFGLAPSALTRAWTDYYLGLVHDHI